MTALRVTQEWLDAYHARAAKWTGNVAPAELRRAPQAVAAAPLAPARGMRGASPVYGPHMLPWPPTGNLAVRHANGVHYLTSAVKRYRAEVAHVLAKHRGPLQRYRLEIEMRPRDNRRRDIDNALKSMLDALVKCGWLPDDSMSVMRELTVRVGAARSGDVLVTATDAL